MNRIILALDTTNLKEAISVTKKIKNKIFTIKLGLEFFNAHGKEGVKKFNEIGITNLMLDLKLKDIPETVYKAVKALDNIKFGFLTTQIILVIHIMNLRQKVLYLQMMFSMLQYFYG